MGSPFFRFAIAASVLAVAPSLATAGPIGWSYTAHVRTTNGLGVLNLGTPRLFVDPSGNGTGDPVFGDYRITAPLPEARMSGAYSGSAGLGMPNDPVRLFSVGYPYSVDPVASAPASDTAFLLTFTLTDRTSGQSGTVDFVGGVGASTTDQFPPSVLFTGGFNNPTQELTLGGNRYRITANGGLPDEIQEPATVSLSVLATANTPEPATLAMAGLGLGAVGMSRLRRRRHPIG